MLPTDPELMPARPWGELLSDARRRGSRLRRRRRLTQAAPLLMAIALLVAGPLTPAGPPDDQRVRVTDRDGDQRVATTDDDSPPTTTPPRSTTTGRGSLGVGEPTPRSAPNPDSPEVGPAPRRARRIAFYRGDQVSGQFEIAQGALWISNADGTGARQLSSATLCRPAWSPDASRLLFCRPATTPDRYRIHSINADGSDERFLRAGNDSSFAPDGTRVAFADAQGGDLGDIWTMAADGSDPRRLSQTGDQDAFPTYSPDGDRIAFIRSSGAMAAGATALWVMNADGSAPRMLADVTGTALPIDWSPDGSKIVYTCAGTNVDLCIVDADGTNETRLLSTPAVESAPNWSDDGEWIVFSRDEDDPYAGVPMELWLIRPNGTDLRRVTSGGTAHGDNLPAFEPLT